MPVMSARRVLLPVLWAALSFALLPAAMPAVLPAQATKEKKDKAEKAPKTPKTPKLDSAGNAVAKKAPNPRLFRSELPFDVTLTLNMKQIKRDKQQDAPWRTASMSYTDSSGKKVSVPIRAKTRGVWRLKHCDFPPLRLKFGGKTADGTEFANLEEPKLVGYCRNTAQYEQYNLQEAQLYRVYRQLTELSHKVRLLRISYADSATGTVETTRYGFLIEDPAQMAERVGGKILARKGATADDLDPAHTAMAYTFLYFIANTDVSFNGLHNGEIVTLSNGIYAPVGYDFDFSGVINAHYAGTDPSLPIRSVRTRLFRGWCAHEAAYPAVYEIFKAKRPAIEALYADTIGKLIAPGTVKSTLSYFDEFYKDIRTPESAKKALLSDCLK
jgi:hypothetical protein